MKSKAVIFGCGAQGQYFFEKFNRDFDIIAFADNNSKLWGTVLLGKPVIAPCEIKTDDKTAVFVCVQFGFIDIARQLESLNIPCFINRRGVCYRYTDTILYPVPLKRHSPFKKPSECYSVLFVQEVVCGRTDKISMVLKNKGVVCHNAFLIRSSQMPEAYDKENSFYSYDDLLEFVNKSDFDIVHCSNEPDILSDLLLHSNKPVIFDTHDLLTARNNDSIHEVYYLEYTSSKFADGTMYVGEYYRDLQAERYGFPLDKTFVIPNLPLEGQLPSKGQRKPKLSAADGGLHLVYEGGISDNPRSHRFFENLWAAITASGIHIHYYSQQNIEYCRALEKTSQFLHYEGNLSSLDLIVEMTQYDVGLLILNPVDKNADMAYPNKLYEYLAAGLPVVSNLTTSSGFAAAHKVGGSLDFSADIKAQMQEYAQIRIPDDYLRNTGLTMDSYAGELLAFYKKISGRSKAVKE